MLVKELQRQEKQTGETFVVFEADKLRVQLIDTYGTKKTLDDLLYIIACRRLADKFAS